MEASLAVSTRQPSPWAQVLQAVGRTDLSLLGVIGEVRWTALDKTVIGRLLRVAPQPRTSIQKGVPHPPPRLQHAVLRLVLYGVARLVGKLRVQQVVGTYLTLVSRIMAE